MKNSRRLKFSKKIFRKAGDKSIIFGRNEKNPEA